MLLLVIVCLVFYALLGFGTKLEGNDPKNASLYKWIFFYTIGAFAVIFLVALFSNSVFDINVTAIPLLIVSYFMGLASLFRFRQGMITIPVVVDLVFGLGILYFIIYLFLEILQRYGFYKSFTIGWEPIVFSLAIQGIFGAIVLARMRKK